MRSLEIYWHHYDSGEDREARFGLHSLQQLAHRYVGVPVVPFLDLGALPEPGVGLAEKQKGAALLGGVE